MNAPERKKPNMQTLELAARPSPLSQYLAAARSMGRRVPRDAKLPGLQLVRPKVKLSERHIARYAQVCGFRPSQGVPPTYPHMLAFPLHMQLLTSDGFPYPVIGLVHLANSIEQHQILKAGDEVRVEVEFGDFVAHEKGQAFVLLSRILRNGQLAWTSQSTYLRRGISQPQGDPYISALSDPTPLSAQAEFAATGNIGRRYARVSGDYNPIHLSALTAKFLGFNRAIAHGMWTKAKALATLLPQQPVEHLSVEVEFKLPLFLPGKASLWSSVNPTRTLFEVRDGKGAKPHLRGLLVRR